MARRIAVTLTLETRQYIDAAVKAAMETKGLDEELKGLDREMSTVERKMDELAVTAKVAGKEVGDVGDKSNKASRDLALLDRQIDSTRRRVERLGIEFAATGDKAAGKRFGDQQSLLGKLTALRTTLSGLENDGRPLANVLEDLGKAAAPVAGAAGAGGVQVTSGGLSGAVGTPVLGPLIAGAIIGAVVSLGPILASELGGLVAGAVGTVGVVGGVVAALHDPRVKGGLTQLGDDVKAQFFAAGASFVEPVRKSLAVLDKAFADLHLDQTFALAAPDLQIIVQGLANLAKNIMPGLNNALSRSAPYAAAAAAGFADIGKAIGYLLDRVTQSKGSLEGLKTLLAFISGTLVGIADIIYHAGQAFDFFIRQNERLFHALAQAAEAVGLHSISDHFDVVATAMHRLQDESAGAATNIKGIGEAANDAVGPLTQAANHAKALADATAAIAQAEEDLIRIHLDLAGATIAVAQGWADLSEKLIRGKGNWDDSTQAGRDNQKMLLDQISTLDQQRQAAIRESDGSVAAINKINAKYDEQLDKLLKIAGQAGATKAELDKLKGDYHINVIVTRVETTQLAKASAVDRAMQGFASGGDTPAYAPFVVGEHGPEVMYSSREQFVATKQMWNGSSSGASAPIINNVYILDPATGSVRRASLIQDGQARGVSSATLAAAYP